MFKRMIAALLLSTMLCIGICSCSDTQNPSETDSESVGKIDLTGGTLLDSMYGICGPYIFSMNTSNSTLSRFNVLTKTYATEKLYPEADILNQPGFWTFCSSYGNKLFLSVDPMTVSGHDTYIFGLDISDGSVETIDIIDSNEFVARHYIWVVDNTYYYMRKVLRDGGDKTVPEDYETCIVKKAPFADKFEKLCVLPDDAALRYAVKEGLVVFSNGTIDLYDLNGQFQRTILEWSSSGTPYGFESGQQVASGAYKDGKLYIRGQITVRDGDKATSRQSYLFSVDLSTGVFKKIIDAPIYSFYLADNKLYYASADDRMLYQNEQTEEFVHFSCSPDIRVCNLDGSEDKVIYTNASLRYPSAVSVAVSNGKMYGVFNRFNEETKGEENLGFCELDLNTGTLTPFTRE